VAHIHEQARRSLRRGCFPKPTTARLMDVCGCWPDPGVYDARILAWLANYEPENLRGDHWTDRPRECFGSGVVASGKVVY